MPAEITFAPFPNGEVTAAIVRQQVKTILASRHFVNAERLGRFLCFVAEKTLAGHAAQIKESVIGVEARSPHGHMILGSIRSFAYKPVGFERSFASTTKGKARTICS